VEGWRAAGLGSLRTTGPGKTWRGREEGSLGLRDGFVHNCTCLAEEVTEGGEATVPTFLCLEVMQI
jgi:hypothetical protein